MPQLFTGFGDGLGIAGFQIVKMLGQQVECLGNFVLLLSGFLQGLLLRGGILGFDTFLERLAGGFGGLADHFPSGIRISRPFTAVLGGHVLRIGVAL